MIPKREWKNNKFCRSSALFFTNCTNTTVKKFPLRRCLEDVNTGTNSISSLRPNLSAVPKTPLGSLPTFAILREWTEINAKKLKKQKNKKHIHFDSRLRTFAFPTLAFVVAKASYSHSCNIHYPLRWRIRHDKNLNNTCKVVSSQRVSVKMVNPPSLPFSDIIRTRRSLWFSSTGTLVPHPNANKSEKGIINYIHEIDSSILVLLQTRMIKCGKVSR